MKLPSAIGRAGGGGGIGGLFLQHGEKLGFLLIALVGGWLMWGGLSSILTKRPTADMLPTAIRSQAESAEQHVRQSTPLPEEMKTSGDVGKVTGQLAAWSKPTVAPPAEFALLDKPLFNAFEKRTKPDVFPIEDLHAEAGLAVLPQPGGFGRPGMSGGFPGSGMGPMGFGPQGFGQDDFSGEGAGGEEGIEGDSGFGGLTPDDGKGEEGGFGGFPGGRGMGSGMGSGGFGPPGMGFGRGPDRAPGTAVPFVVVTGLVPYGKQTTEYEVRYGQSSYREPERDSPKWDIFLVERAEDDGSGNLNWERLDTKAAAEKASREWSPSQELLPQDCLLSPFDVPELRRSQQMVSPFAYNMPLPRRLDGPWGAEAIHPWFRGFLEKRRDEQRAMGAAMGSGSGGGAMGMRGGMGPGMMGSGSGMMGSGSGMMGSGSGMMSSGPGMMGSGSSMGSSMGPGRMMGSSGRGMRGMGSGAGPGMEGGGFGGGSIFSEEGEDAGNEMMMGDNQMFMQAAPVEYRLFRFIDTDVKPGKTYRYRVRVSLWNPNIKLHPQYLASEDVATPTKLASEPSEPSEAVRVPQESLLLARTLDRADARKVRGLVEALVLGPQSKKNGNFSLRSVGLNRGGMANVAEQEGNVRDRGTQGEPITTDSMLVDVMGTQEKPDDRRRDKEKRVPEPLDMLFMRPDGSLDVVSAADTERQATQYLPTLGGDQDRRGENGPQRGPPGSGPPGFGPGGGSSPFGGGSSSPFGGGASSPFGGGGSSQGGYGGGFGSGERP